MMRVRTAVFPVAGLGTRFFPATRALPKELLPIVDRPIIHYAVQEAREAGIERFIFVTKRGKTVIEDHFDRNPGLERDLLEMGKEATLEALRDEMPEPGTFSYVRQGSPQGLGHAVACARNSVGDEPFAVLLPDDFIRSDQPATRSLIDAYETAGGGHLVGVQEVAPADTHRYGIIDPGTTQGNVIEVRSMVEKPAPESAPSRLAAIGRYVLDPDIFQQLDRITVDPGDELQLTAALDAVAAQGRLHAVAVVGERFDCGSKLGLIQANIRHALDQQDLGERLRRFLRGLDLSPEAANDPGVRSEKED